MAALSFREAPLHKHADIPQGCNSLFGGEPVVSLRSTTGYQLCKRLD